MAKEKERKIISPKTISIKESDHKSVGMIIQQRENILLIERKKFLFWFAPPAGHIDDRGSFRNAAQEEVKEEVGLLATKIKLITEEGIKNNPCRRTNGS